MPTDPCLHPRSTAPNSTGVKGSALGSKKSGEGRLSPEPKSLTASIEALLIAPVGRGTRRMEGKDPEYS